MKFTCSRDDILKEISVAQEVISSKNSLSVLSNVLLTVTKGELSLQATDLKVGFQTSLPVETVQEGTTTAFCDKLQGILRSLPEGEVELEQVDATMLRIKPTSRKIDFQLRCIPSDKYPELARVADNQYFEFPQKDFIDMVAKTVFAVSDDETRYFMNGIFLEKRDENLVMVATDGRRLAFISRKIPVRMENMKGIILPPKILTIVRKLSSGEGSLSLALTDKNVFVRIGATNLSSNLIDGQFPDYRRVSTGRPEVPRRCGSPAAGGRPSPRLAPRRAEVPQSRLLPCQRDTHYPVQGKRARDSLRRVVLRLRRPRDATGGQLPLHDGASARACL